ncbi:CorA family divalent cation transporter [Sporofaciens sp. SGI.106]|uniref:magnesium transporter CorA family protein n=1 Tax=Sporofaciens sp. SGI.106 TaxID=3420568 RepID=UPI002A97DC85|nr:CorA family divalent cation transporter [Lachnoclostridium sp.]
MILGLGPVLEEITIEELQMTGRSAVFITDSTNVKEIMEIAEMNYEGEIQLNDVQFCKVETQQECMAGSLAIPRLMEVLGYRFRMMYFINRKHIVIVDDNHFAERIIRRIQHNRTRQGQSKERFLYNFLTLIINKDQEVLNQYERRIMRLEENVMEDKLGNFQHDITPVRRELLVLRSYYDELMDMGKELADNENNFFSKKNLKYFDTFVDRADRLMSRTAHLLEYATQVRDSYQEKVSEQQNKNMQFLTVISTIFFPLTLITGWYGMNFQNMPELEHGYPGIILFSIAVVVTIILIFKKKKII